MFLMGTSLFTGLAGFVLFQYSLQIKSFCLGIPWTCDYFPTRKLIADAVPAKYVIFAV